MTNIQNLALSYIKAVYKGREVVLDERGYITIRSAPDHYGSTYFSKVAYIGTSGAGRDCLVDCTGDDDRIMAYLG